MEDMFCYGNFVCPGRDCGVDHLQKTGSKSNTISGRGCISCVGSHVFPGDEYAGECGNRAGNVYFSQYSDVCGGYRCG